MSFWKRSNMRIIFLLLFFCFLIQDLYSHPLAPSFYKIWEKDKGIFKVLWKGPEMRVRGEKVTPLIPEGCEALGKPNYSYENTGFIKSYKMSCDSSLIGKKIEVQGLNKSKRNVLLHITFKDKRLIQEVLNSKKSKIVIPKSFSSWDFFKKYIILGFEHILSGADHLLFIFALIILMTHFKTIFVTITFFTIGHSITLSLAVLDLIYLSPRVSEFGIALTLLILAAEIDQKKKSIMTRYPWGMPLFFGLIHGLGFAGALKEVGLPQSEIPLTLFSFNLGIELGQVFFIGVLFFSLFLIRKVKLTIPFWAQKIQTYALGSVAAFWCIERAFF